MKEFVPKKTITVQLPMEIVVKFMELCNKLDVSKTKMIENMILKTCEMEEVKS